MIVLSYLAHQFYLKNYTPNHILYHLLDTFSAKPQHRGKRATDAPDTEQPHRDGHCSSGIGRRSHYPYLHIQETGVQHDARKQKQVTNHHLLRG